jgi:hypothetical protein
VIEAKHAPSGIYLVSRFIMSSLLIECWSLSQGWVWRWILLLVAEETVSRMPPNAAGTLSLNVTSFKEMIGLYLQHTALDSLKSIDLDVWGVGK